jgi:P-type conjugative transfer protein TrbJ
MSCLLKIRPSALIVLLSTILIVMPARALPVFDAAVYSQTLLEASRALTQINNQIQSLQNEATMLQNMATNLKKLDFNSVSRMTAGLQQVDALMLQAQGISYNIKTTTTQYQALYPQQYADAATSNQLMMDAKTRWLASMNGYQQTMSVQSQVVQNVQSDRGLLQDLVNQSQGAQGSLQAQQATNQLLALSTKQQLQIQTMMAAQFRAEATEQARAAESQEQGRASTKKFLGNRKAYTPN